MGTGSPRKTRPPYEDDVNEIEHWLREFATGRASFERLTQKIGRILADNGIADQDFDYLLQKFIDAGRLPHELALLVRQEALEICDRLLREANRTAAPSAPQGAVGQPGEADPYQQRVEEVVLSALVDGFRSMRDQGRDGHTAQGNHDDRQLDAALTDFRGARLRREAQKAEAGERRSGVTARPADDGKKAVTVGSMLKDRFVLDKELGRGGMGVVYRAVDRRRLEAMHQFPYVAVKLLSGDFRSHPDAFRALENEARKAQELAHPNIVTVFDFDRDGAAIYMVMELLEGNPLDEVLKEAAPLEPNAGLGLIDGICAGLAHAHAQGVVHADLKPANVFIAKDGRVKLLDFGIASASRAGGFNAETLGAYTAAYASPEMMDGAPRDPRDDVYALGCVAHMVLTGRHPFDRLSGAEVSKRNLALTQADDLTDAQWQVLSRSLAIQRADRQHDAAAFHAEFFGRTLPGR